MPIRKPSGQAMPDVVGTDLHDRAARVALSNGGNRDLECTPQHVALAPGEKQMVAQCLRVALDPPVAGGDVCHLASRPRVACLALLAFLAGRTLQPFGVSTVDADAQDRALVARCAIAAVPIEWRVGILASVHVVERAKEELPFAGPKQLDAESAVGEADGSQPGIRNLVAVIAVYSVPRHAPNLAQIEIGSVPVRHGRRVTGSTNADAIGLLVAQAPADAGL